VPAADRCASVKRIVLALGRRRRAEADARALHAEVRASGFDLPLAAAVASAERDAGAILLPRLATAAGSSFGRVRTRTRGVLRGAPIGRRRSKRSGVAEDVEVVSEERR